MTEPVRAYTLLSVIDEILRLQARFEVLFAGVYGGARLSTLERLVLSAVFEAHVPPTVPQIGRNLGYPRQAIQRAANDLLDKGLLVQAPNPHHKRAHLLVPTETAKQMKREVEARAIATAEAFLGTVSADRCQALKAELRALCRAIEAYTDGGKAVENMEATNFSTAGLMALL